MRPSAAAQCGWVRVGVGEVGKLQRWRRHQKVTKSTFFWITSTNSNGENSCGSAVITASPRTVCISVPKNSRTVRIRTVRGLILYYMASKFFRKSALFEYYISKSTLFESTIFESTLYESALFESMAALFESTVFESALFEYFP